MLVQLYINSVLDLGAFIVYQTVVHEMYSRWIFQVIENDRHLSYEKRDTLKSHANLPSIHKTFTAQDTVIK